MEKVVKRPMKDSLASKLRIHLPYIEEQIEAKDLLTYLFSKSIIDVDDKETVSRAVTRRERACCLVTLLMNRSDRAYDCFLDALRKASYTQVVNKINGLANQTSEDSDAGAAAAHGDRVTIPLHEIVKCLQDQAVLHDIRLQRLSKRLDNAASKEELKIIQKEIRNLDAAYKKELEIEKLKAQLKAKEDELAKLSTETSAQVEQLLAEIESLKKQTESGERELQQFKEEKAELENKVQHLISNDEVNSERIKKVEDIVQVLSDKLRPQASSVPKHRRSCRCEACNRPPDPPRNAPEKSLHSWKY